MNHESDEDVDLEALRVAALKSRKPRYPRINHNNLIPIVPVNVETPDNIKAKIKQEKISPAREINIQGENKIKDSNVKEDEKTSDHSGSALENDPDILSMDDKEEEDSLEKLMDQLEAEISGKAPIPSSKKFTKLNEKNKQNDNGIEDDEVELLQVKSGKEPKAIIEIRESASPEPNSKQIFRRNSVSPKRSPGQRSRSRVRSRSRSRSRSFYSGGRSYRRSKSPFWSRSPHKSRSPFRRSRSPYWSSRRTRSKSRSPFRRYRSPGRKRSPLSRFSRSRSRSYGRRRSPWSFSPRRRSKSPFYRDGILSPRRRNFISPVRSRRSYTPKDGSKSPRRRSRSPRRALRRSPYLRSKSPYRSRSPYRRNSLRRSQSPFLRRSKSPIDKLNSPNRSPVSKKRSNSPIHKSVERASSPSRRTTRPKTGGSRSKSPIPSKNRSPLKVVEKNKLDEKIEKSRDRLGRRHRSLSRENSRTHDRRSHRRGFFPSRKRSSRSPKQKRTPDKNKVESKTEKEPSPVPSAPLDPILEARKKKFETLGEVDPTVGKKINLKAIKESTENPEEDEDALTINIENNLWDESEESEDEFESRFKCDGAKRNRVGNRTVMSFRNLRESDTNKKVLNKPLTDENRRDRNHKQDPWPGRRNDRERKKRPLNRGRSEDNESSKSKFKSEKTVDSDAKKSHRKPIVWYSKDERKSRPESKDNEVSAMQTIISDNKSKSSVKSFNESDKGGKNSEYFESDDFDKLISDFEKELESDTCFSTNEVTSVVSTSQEENRKPRITIKRDLFEPKTPTVQLITKLPPPRIVKLRYSSSTKLEKNLDLKSLTKGPEIKEKIPQDESKEVQDGPEDYVEDDNFVLEVSATRQKRGKEEEEDKQSDLRAVLSKRRNERLAKVVTLQENMPTRLVQSAFQGLGQNAGTAGNLEQKRYCASGFKCRPHYACKNASKFIYFIERL